MTHYKIIVRCFAFPFMIFNLIIFIFVINIIQIVVKTDLSSYDNSWYKPGSRIKLFTWYMMNLFFVRNPLNASSGTKVFFLRLFGAKIGQHVVIKPGVNIKYPWFLSLGDYVWLGENVWIDNLDRVAIGANTCISQGAYILTGNHNYKKSSFDLMTRPIEIGEGVWIGAKAVVCPGVKCESHSVLTVGSVATENMVAYTIYQGIPAKPIKERKIDSLK